MMAETAYPPTLWESYSATIYGTNQLFSDSITNLGYHLLSSQAIYETYRK